MKIVLTNESGKDLQLLFYDVDYTLGDAHGTEDLYFHAHYRRENPTSLQRDFDILPLVHGRGRFLGTNLCVRADTQKYMDKWWGEGEVKVYLDGDFDWPTLAGTGTEDYIGTAWGIQKAYADLYQGSPFVDSGTMQYCFYRFHVPDPVYFRNDIRVTIQQIGFTLDKSASDPLYRTGTPIYNASPGLVKKKPGELGTFERQDDWSSVAYFYLDRPYNDLPPIDSPEQRMKGMEWGGPYFDDVR